MKINILVSGEEHSRIKLEEIAMNDHLILVTFLVVLKALKNRIC